MKSFPHYFRIDSQPSSLICLQIVCKYYGVFYSTDHLQTVLPNFQSASSIYSLREIAEVLGLRTKVFKITWLRVASVQHPCILQLTAERFVVLYKVKGNVAYISDPEEGLIKCNLVELVKADQMEDVSVLLLEPSPNFNGSESTTDRLSLNYLLAYLRPHKKLLIQVLLAFFGGGILSLFFPLLTQAVVDIGIGTTNIDFIKLVLVAQLILMISQSLIEFLRNWILLNVSLKIIITLLSDFLIKLLKLPIGFYQRKLIGDIRQRIEDNSRVHEFLTKNVLSTIFGGFTFLIYSIIIGIYSVQILLIFYGGCVVYVVWILAFLKQRRILDSKRFTEAVADQNKVYEMLTGIQDIKLNGWEDQKRFEWEGIQLKLFRISLQSLKLNQFQNIGAQIITQVVNLTISFLAVTAVITGEITLGAMFAIQFIVGQLGGPVNDFIFFITAAQDTKISLERIKEINNETDETSTPSAIYKLPLDQSIILKDLSFGYTENELILKDINAHIPHGKVTAVVGESGSGKTTIIRLILRYFDIKKGQINIGETSLNDFDIKTWRSNCGAVMQDGIIFSDTIINNIALGQSDINNQQLDYATDVANIKEFILQLPLRYQTLVGRGGMNLSQGQQQRILIARAVYRNPSFLFFDEATNALDTKNEATIVQKLNSFYKGRTVIIVAHRLSTVQNADQILVLSQGRIIEQGTHSSLYGLKGHYYSLVRNQLEIPM